MDNQQSHDALLGMLGKIRESIADSIYSANFDYQRSVNTLKQHLDVAQRINDPVLAGRTLSMLGMIEMDRNADYARAEEYILQAIDVYEEAQSPQQVGSMLNNLGEVYRRSGDPERASSYYAKARDLARQTENTAGEIYVYSNEGMLWVSEAQPERAIELLQQAVQMANGLMPMPDSVKKLLAETYFGLATSYLQLDDLVLARQMAVLSMEYAQEANLIDQLAMAHQVTAEVAMRDPDATDNIEALLSRSELHWRQYKGPNELGRFLMVKSDYRLQLGDVEGSRLALEEASTHFQTARHDRQVEYIHDRLAQAPFVVD